MLLALVSKFSFHPITFNFHSSSRPSPLLTRHLRAPSSVTAIVPLGVLTLDRRDGMHGRLVSELKSAAALGGTGSTGRLLQNALRRGVAVGVREAGLLERTVAALVEAGVAGSWGDW